MRTFSEQNHDRPRDPDALEDEVQTLRDDLGDLVHELDRRRRRVLDWRGQLERHRGALTVAAVVAGVALVGGLGLRARRRRRQHSVLGRLENLRSLLVAASENPDRFLRKAAQPAPTRKMLTQALLAVGGIAVRAALDRALQAPAEHDYEI